MTRSPSPLSRPHPAGLVLLLLAALVAPPGRWAVAQDKTDKAAGVFDEEKTPKEKDQDKTATKEPAKNKGTGTTARDTAKQDAAKPPDKDKAKPAPGGAVDRETIGFTQDNAASQMTELEERMFRLSEALRGLEPENASRLRLALKFSREELILEQMRETNKMLKGAQLAKAETEVRELLAKLEHLRDVLLAEDLDFQLKLARLRQMRETLGQLDRVVMEQRRELGWSRFATEQRKAKEKLAARRPDLDSLARDQKAVIADTRAMSEKKDGADRGSARAALSGRETALVKTAAALASDPLFADYQPSQLHKAEGLLSEAASKLGAEGDDVSAALAAEEKAAATLQEELNGMGGRIAQAGRDVAEAEFRRHETGQHKTRNNAEALASASARLGDAGVALQKDLIRAGGSMRSAEKGLQKTAPDSAATDQSAALDVLTKSSEELARAAEKLLVQLRTELQQRLIAELTEMHEIQGSLRETTESQVPRLAKKSRAATIAMAGLSQKEAELAARTEQLLALVEETEFGIALPTALRVLSREMRVVEGWLKEADASGRTIKMEKRIEDDLLGLLQAVRRLPPTTPPQPGDPLPSDLRERERELNRLVAELKMIRLLQGRLNDDTVVVDKDRPEAPALPAPLRKEVEALESTQEELRENLSKIAERIEQDR